MYTFFCLGIRKCDVQKLFHFVITLFPKGYFSSLQYRSIICMVIKMNFNLGNKVEDFLHELC